jgi:hypothetical protein
MPKLKVNISVSLDGFVAGPNQSSRSRSAAAASSCTSTRLSAPG